jgi:hypothetical protein
MDGSTAPLLATLNNFISIAQLVIGTVSVFFLCVAAFYFVSSGGNPQAIERAKSAAFNCCIGFALALSAGVIKNLIAGAVVQG